MKFEAKYQGKWVVAKGEKIIADSVSLNKLMQKVKKEDPNRLTFSLVPKGFIASNFIRAKRLPGKFLCYS